MSIYTTRMQEQMERIEQTPAPIDCLAILEEAEANLRSHILETVRDARQAGSSWQEIGNILGISKQAAHKRFSNPFDKSDTL